MMQSNEFDIDKEMKETNEMIFGKKEEKKKEVKKEKKKDKKKKKKK